MIVGVVIKTFCPSQEYEKGESPEALVVKDLDKFDMISQAFEYEQSEEKPKSLQEFFDSTNSNGKCTYEQSHLLMYSSAICTTDVPRRSPFQATFEQTW